MNPTSSQRPARRGRIFPEDTIPPEELAKEQAELENFYKRCRPIFEKVKSKLLKNHYNWFIVIEPESGDYFIDVNPEIASQKAHQKYPHTTVGVFRLNKTGACGRI
jgi:hypothetical protein